jgi:hypothetical protein
MMTAQPEGNFVTGGTAVATTVTCANIVMATDQIAGATFPIVFVR